MRVAYFTAGRTGAGHLARGIAIERGLRRADPSVEYRIFAPAPPFTLDARTELAVVAMDRDELRDPRRAKESTLARALTAYAPDLLLVDHYWAPLRFVLPLAACEAWLLLHWVPPFWLTGPDAVVRWDPTQYARVIGIEPFALDGVREHIDPIVVANPGECRPARALRERFGVPEGARLHVVAQAGKPGERDALVEAVRARDPDAVVLAFSPYDAQALFPVCEWLAGADRIACGAGYNAWWEAHWLAYAERTDFTPFPRTGGADDQAWRVAHVTRGRAPRENGADALARLVSARSAAR